MIVVSDSCDKVEKLLGNVSVCARVPVECTSSNLQFYQLNLCVFSVVCIQVCNCIISLMSVRACLRLCTICSAATFHSVTFSKPNPVWLGKVTPKNCVWFSKPIPIWFGKKKIDFASCIFQSKFRLVWKILMTIVNVLKIPNHIQFGLEKSLLPTPWTLNQFLFCFGNLIFERENTQTYK